ncbi:unnamed protein product [Blepharisma stoltei]|uniref:Uncharacterized protein n=1 Tax=Blepharisma stoltei TaxID=1481888 RepID=A0AAU9IY16_9CILI|nr:unnamed protein product [Blepharisma stoltei]
MPVLKIRNTDQVKKVRLKSLDWDSFTQIIKDSCNVGDLASYKIVCKRPIPGKIFANQADLDEIRDESMIDIELTYQDESFICQVFKEVLLQKESRNHVLNRFIEIIRQFPSTTLDALVPPSIERSLRDKLEEIYQEASTRANQPKFGFKLMYVMEGGKQSLRAVPNQEWINYSTMDIDVLSRSLPPNVIQRLSNSKKEIKTKD